MLGQRRRRCPSIETALGQRLSLTEMRLWNASPCQIVPQQGRVDIYFSVINFKFDFPFLVARH